MSFHFSDDNMEGECSDMEVEHVELQKLVSSPDGNRERTEESSSKPQLKRELTLFHLIGLVVGGIIGSGIFISPREVVRDVQSYGMALVIWVLAGLIAMAGGLCYSELGTMIKKSSGEVAYIKQAYSFNSKKPNYIILGELLSFLFVWSTSLFVRPAGVAIVLLTFGEYITKAAQPYCDISNNSIRVLALAALGVMALVNCYSAKLSATLTSAFSFVKLLAAALIIAVGLLQFSKVTTETQPHGLFEGTSSNPAKMAYAFYAALWAYDGWSSVNYAAEEVKDVEKNLPRAIVIGLPIIIFVYALINISLFAVLSIHDIIISDSGAIAIPFGYRTMDDAGLVVIPLIVACSTFGAANASVFAVARMFVIGVLFNRLNYASGRDGILPKFLGSVHIHYKTPIPAVIFHTVLSTLMILSGGITDLLNGASAAIWVFYTLCFIGVIIMRSTYRQTPRPFKVWTFIPIMMTVIGTMLVLLPFSNPQEAFYEFVAIGMVLLGIPVYFVLVRGWHRPPILTTINDRLAVTLDKLLNTSSSVTSS